MRRHPRIRKSLIWAISEGLPLLAIYILYRYHGPEWLYLLCGAAFVLAVGFWIAVMQLSHRQRRHRITQGLCLTCGYDRTGLAAGAVCPECGAAPVSV